jgi:hypothetical protein
MRSPRPSGVDEICVLELPVICAHVGTWQRSHRPRNFPRCTIQELCTGVFLKRTNDFSGDTRHKAVRRNILRDNRSGCDH